MKRAPAATRRWWKCLGIPLIVLLAGSARAAEPAVWQWSVPMGESRAWLWIPEHCEEVRAVVFAKHNMIERGILEHPAMRGALADIGIAEVFVYPSDGPVFDFSDGAGERFELLLARLAEASGYDEISSAPVVPMGHSAHASFPWNFAAWNPGRTLAALSVKGDGPLTDLTGSGRPNPDWGNRTLAGVPGLMVMGEYEWWEKRLDPLRTYREEHPDAPLALYADAGAGHFEAGDRLVRFLAMFIRKAAAARLPETPGGALRPVDPKQGWLVDRWRGDAMPRAEAAAFANYDGDRSEAFWCFDAATARATEEAHASSRGKKPLQVGFKQEGGFVAISNSHAGTELGFRPGGDGLTFRLEADFMEPLPPDPPLATKDERPPARVVVPKAAAPGRHPEGEVTVSKIVGPVEALGGGRFRFSPDWMTPPPGDRTPEAWFIARHPGDEEFKPSARQAVMRFPWRTEGLAQSIDFAEIADQPANAARLELEAVSDRGLPVRYYVREGPAYVRGGSLHFTPVPPAAKYPVRITVVAWQEGTAGDPAIRAAAPCERSFLLLDSEPGR